MAVNSSIPAAITYLVAQVGGLAECAAPVVVSDGWPTQRSDSGVAIGVTPDDGVTESEPLISQLGAQMERETYTVPCVVWCRRVGATPQSAARLAAFVIFDAIMGMLRTDRTLGGALNSGWAQITPVVIMQTVEAVEAGEGRMCEIRFGVTCTNRF